jgi:hypothetical protein
MSARKKAAESHFDALRSKVRDIEAPLNDAIDAIRLLRDNQDHGSVDGQVYLATRLYEHISEIHAKLLEAFRHGKAEAKR